MLTVRYIGWEQLQLDAVTEVQTEALLVRSARKLCRHVKDECGITVHFKVHGGEGNRRKYAVHVRFTAPGMLLVSGKVSDWDLRRAIHGAFRSLEVRLIEETARHSFSAQASAPRRRKLLKYSLTSASL